ncbi:MULTISPECIES: hypothetical protein [Pseudomonas]|uniref:Uncharacterized protein n=1 Tax=Pseudomonas juntendi TaxID=2666183 RepID=A0A7W2PVA1_9PSED|nr:MULTISPECIES: hypothetical protein [Pseudomonas]MBA6062150.1 hypothetical protein [Pseudomonas juntendi]MBA6123152.1 hypothetical protein [Pseudomonas juntendi]MBA6128747.1 hypothetical protein [Pseudomonas juntendi]MBA6140703.1 hypothetical protein [Pseudomonas monteilii]
MRRREFLALKYTTDVKTLMTVECDSGFSVEVFGDGANGSYEWRLVDEAGLVEQHSDCGYGIPAIALRDGLIAYYGTPRDDTELEHVDFRPAEGKLLRQADAPKSLPRKTNDD